MADAEFVSPLEEILCEQVDICGISTATRERAIGTLVFIALLLLLGVCSHLCSGVVQRMSLNVLNGFAVVMMAVSLFGTGLLVIPLMFVLSPLYRVSPSAWYAVGNSLWTPSECACALEPNAS